AKDLFGNTATGYTGSVHFTSSDSQATLPANYTFTAADQGTYTFTNGVTLRTTGSQTITVTDTAAGSITGSATLTVTPPSTATHLLVSAPASSTAGAAFSFTVTALDANNNTVAAYTGTVHFTSSDAQAALPANYTFTNTDAGVHSFSATLKTTGSQSLTGTDTVNSGITGSQSGITVNPATTTPAAPSNLTAAAVSASQIKLAWTDNSNPPNLE